MTSGAEKSVANCTRRSPGSAPLDAGSIPAISTTPCKPPPREFTRGAEAFSCLPADEDDPVITEELVEDVFALPCRVIEDPVSPSPLVIPLGSLGSASSASASSPPSRVPLPR